MSSSGSGSIRERPASPITDESRRPRRAGNGLGQGVDHERVHADLAASAALSSPGIRPTIGTRVITPPFGLRRGERTRGAIDRVAQRRWSFSIRTATTTAVLPGRSLPRRSRLARPHGPRTTSITQGRRRSPVLCAGGLMTDVTARGFAARRHRRWLTRRSPLKTCAPHVSRHVSPRGTRVPHRDLAVSTTYGDNTTNRLSACAPKRD